MNSCLYKARVMHHRYSPREHRFHYGVYMFYVDLDELGMLQKKLWMFSLNRFNFFSFRDKEHLQLTENDSKTTKEQLLGYLAANNIDLGKGRVMLLTNMNVLGYNFNPVSFYFCFDQDDQPVCCVAEVHNTFGEMKPYLAGKEHLSGNKFRLETKKFFYVSPFIDHDTDFDFDLPLPGEKLRIKIDDYQGGKRFFSSTLTGNAKPLTNSNLLLYSIRFPFITLKIIFLIHWQAMLLWLKKIPYHKKSENQNLQKDVYKKYELR